MLAIHQILTEIVEKIEITPDLTIAHPEYPPLELHPALVAMPQLSPQFQLKCTIERVQTYLYDIYFSHRRLSLEEIAIAARQPLQVKNNLIDGIDINFFQRLRQSNTSNGYFDRDWQVVASNGDELVVVKEGLHLHIQPHQHLPPDLRQAEIGDVVPIYLPHSLVDRDTYIIVGNAGIPDRSKSIQIYLHATPDAAVAIAYQLTSGLNTLNIPFQLATLHDPSLFYRYDASTLWLDWADYLKVQPILKLIYRSHQTAFSPQVPLFSKQLAPGLGLVEIPISSDPFGIHRCRLLATGLVTAMAQDRPRSTLKLEAIRQEFATAGIDWQQPHLSFSTTDSNNFYTLDLA